MIDNNVKNALGFTALVDKLVDDGKVTLKNKGDEQHISVGDRIQLAGAKSSFEITPFDLRDDKLADKKMAEIASRALGIEMRVVRGPLNTVEFMVGLDASNNLVIVDLTNFTRAFGAETLSQTVVDPVRMTELISGDNFKDSSGTYYASRHIDERVKGKFGLPQGISNYIFSEKYSSPWVRIRQSLLEGGSDISTTDVRAVLWAQFNLENFRHTGGRVTGLNDESL